MPLGMRVSSPDRAHSCFNYCTSICLRGNPATGISLRQTSRLVLASRPLPSDEANELQDVSGLSKLVPEGGGREKKKERKKAQDAPRPGGYARLGGSERVEVAFLDC